MNGDFLLYLCNIKISSLLNETKKSNQQEEIEKSSRRFAIASLLSYWEL